MTAVIVNYRTYDLVEQCVASLRASTHPPDEIVLVDNGSDPRSLAAMTARIADPLTVIADPSNPGYAVACNQGWRASRGSFVLFLNPDVTVSRDCLERCLTVATTDETIGIVTARLMRPDGRLDHACHRGMPTPLASLAYALRLHRLFPRSRRLGRYTLSWMTTDRDHDIEACSGAFMFVRRDALKDVGGWDERYWFYAEDIDLCVRVARTGRRVRFVAGATAIHLKGASSLLRAARHVMGPADRRHRRRIQRAIIDSHSLFFREHFEADTPPPVSLAIRALFAVQRLRVAVGARFDRLRTV